ncbi:MAG: hypothetical protein HRT35_28110 [Algicola sp.]|nr:hypothetical protein [Algicola sp.]
MKWADIHKQYPNRFVLLGNIIEEKISEFKSKIVSGTVIEVFENGNDIRSAYRVHNKRGEDVLYSWPTTADEFIVENRHTSKC